MSVASSIVDGLSFTNISSLVIGLLVILVAYIIWPLLNNKLSHVPGPTPLPMFGNFVQGIKMGFAKFDAVNLMKYRKYFRSFEGRDPSIVIGDQEILKQILIKKFDNFPDRGKMILRGVVKESLPDVRGAKWYRLRHLMTPDFTSMRLKKMESSVVGCVKKMSRNIEAIGSEAFDAKVITGSFAIDAIAITGFGIDLDSKNDRHNPFLRHCLAISNFKPGFGFLCAFFLPFTTGLFEMLGVTMLPRESMDFMARLLQKILDERKKDKEPHYDLLQLLVDAHKEKLCVEGIEDPSEEDVSLGKKEDGLTSSEMLAQGILFFLGAFDTTSTALAFMMYELSENPDVQDKVYQEVSEVMSSYAEISLDAISEMPYLDQCEQEVLRKYPSTIRIDRLANADITLNGLFIPRDTRVVIPTYALHHDPDVWPDPDKFNPDRFTAERKNDRPPMSYLPFGLGPRHCIGMRMGLMEMKMACAKLVQNFKLLPAGMKPDLELNFLVRSKNGIMVKAEKR